MKDGGWDGWYFREKSINSFEYIESKWMTQKSNETFIYTVCYKCLERNRPETNKQFSSWVSNSSLIDCVITTLCTHQAAHPATLYRNMCDTKENQTNNSICINTTESKWSENKADNKAKSGKRKKLIVMARIMTIMNNVVTKMVFSTRSEYDINFYLKSNNNNNCAEE